MQLLQIIKGGLSNPELAAGSVIILAFAIIALVAPLIAPPQGEFRYLLPRDDDGSGPLPGPPRPGHPLGTMDGQHDVFYGVIWGTRVALWVGLSISLGRALIGVPLGLVSGYYGGVFDAIIMRLTDAFLAFPIMAVAMVVVALVQQSQAGISTGGGVFLGDRTQLFISLVLVVFGWMRHARLIRGNVLAEREREYVLAAISLGARGHRVLFRHLLPNVVQGLFVLIASDVGAMTVLVAVFNFIGLIQHRGALVADWGQMLSISRHWIIGSPQGPFSYWYTYFPPLLAIVLFSVGWNLIGDGLRDVFDPRLTGSRV